MKMSRHLVQLLSKQSAGNSQSHCRATRCASSSLLAHLVRFQSTTTTSGGDEQPHLEIKASPSDSSMSRTVSKYSYRCTFNDPLRHDREHLSKFYQLDNTDLSIFDPFQENLRKEFYQEAKAFNETCLMIREPALNIMSVLRSMTPNQPPHKFVLYGHEEGTGKRCTLFHLLHYCYKDNWLLINLPNCSNVLRYNEREREESTYKEGRWDTPVDAVKFIKRFSTQNMHLLKNLNLKTTKKYNWGGRDSTPIGTSIIDLFEYANSKAKYSSDICAAIVREIKLQSKDKNFKVLVTLDQLNSYFGPTRLKNKDKSEISVDDVTIVHAFKKLLKNDWSNAAVIGIINAAGVIIPAPNRRTKFYDMSIPWGQRRRVECKLHYEGPLTPKHLIKEESFNYLKPFVAVDVPKYSSLEATNQFEYYKDRNWLQSPQARTDDGREELVFLSGRNPAQFMRVCQTI